MEHSESPNSTKKLKISLQGRELGKILIVNGNLIVESSNPEDKTFLEQRLSSIWIPQSGIPILRRDIDGTFPKNPSGKFITDGFANFQSKKPDELLDALLNLTQAMGVFQVEEELT